MADVRNGATIVECTIIGPKGWGGQATVHAKFSDGTESDVFKYYDDELSFTESEFIGLTYEQSMELFRRKDIAYLQS